MALHLLKLSVGSESVAGLAAWQAAHRVRDGLSWHGTRMAPRRRTELLAGGSIYWIIRGRIQARQLLRDIVPVHRPDGTKAVRLVFEAPLIEVVSRPHRAFQGWRYLAPEDAPPDALAIARGPEESEEEMPPELRERLSELGLL